jgi:DNA polymerase-3 subunit beta
MQLKQLARDALLRPLQAVSGIVERRHTLPILANVLIEHRDAKLYVTATDLEMQITAHSDLSGKESQATTLLRGSFRISCVRFPMMRHCRSMAQAVE